MICRTSGKQVKYAGGRGKVGSVGAASGVDVICRSDREESHDPWRAGIVYGSDWGTGIYHGAG